jgi:hypothetical protein
MSSEREKMGDRAPSIKEQEVQLAEEEKHRAELRRFDEGFAEYEDRLADEELEWIEGDPASEEDS